MEFATIWWVWLCVALGLAILEVAAPGFIFLGFAIGAAAVGVLLLLPLGLSLPMIMAIFAVFSLVAWLMLRHFFKAPDNTARIITKDINK